MGRGRNEQTRSSANGNGSKRRVGIACQGGGSHTAFTAGVLQGLMERLPSDTEVVALSGTSGGAICATLAWDGLVRRDRKLAIQKLREFWDAMAAREPWDRVFNQYLLGMIELRDVMGMPEISPYQLPTWGEERFRNLLLQYFNFEELRQLARRPGAPIIRISAVEVLSGHFEMFDGESLCVECILASAAIPELYRAVSVPDRGIYWDGLFSQNPPIKELIRHRIDELWLIQINSSTCLRIPTEPHEIADRRNALAGNLSMEQELRFIEVINRAIAEGKLNNSDFRPVRVERIALDRDLGYRSKLDRKAELLDELRDYGKVKSQQFLRGRESRIASRL
ncbi:MAG TPA: patatin-like phospholipase family protein [Candidatus Acidoferrum sp.]|nr:patatin-like phospholipase family protein [Candidatus Acidoferrum sp.]